MSNQARRRTADDLVATLQDQGGETCKGWRDPVIEALMQDVDRSLLRENLRRTPEQRAARFLAVARSVYECRGAANPKVAVWR